MTSIPSQPITQPRTFVRESGQKTQALIRRIFVWGYQRVTHKAPSDRVMSFVDNFGYVAIAEIIASVIGFPVKILVGRFLGPEEFGKFSLVLSLVQFFLIPMLFGLTTAALKFLPSQPERKKEIISIISCLSLATTTGSILLLILTKTVWLRSFGITDDIFWWGLLLSVINAAYFIFEAMNRGLQNYRLYFISTIVSSFALLASFCFFLFVLNEHTYRAFVMTMIVNFLVGTFFFLRPTMRGWSLNFVSWTQSRSILHYASYAILGGITGAIIGNTDRFFLNHYVSLYWVGVYSAYINASTVLVGKFFQLFLNVYFPTLTGDRDKANIGRRLRIVAIVSILPVFLLSVGSIFLVMWLFGKEFPIRLDLVILFSVINCLYIVYQLYMWLLNAQGPRGIRSVTVILGVGAVLNIILYLILIKPLGVFGVIWTTIGVNFFFLVAFIQLTRSFIKKSLFHEPTP